MTSLIFYNNLCFFAPAFNGAMACLAPFQIGMPILRRFSILGDSKSLVNSGRDLEERGVLNCIPWGIRSEKWLGPWGTGSLGFPVVSLLPKYFQMGSWLHSASLIYRDPDFLGHLKSCKLDIEVSFCL